MSVITLRSKNCPAATGAVGGFTQVELGITLVVAGFLLTLAMPSAAVWLQNTQIRTAADSMVAGLQVARVEALRRNRSVEFILTDDAPDASSGLVPSTTGKNWAIRVFRQPGPNLPGDFVQGKSGAESSAKVAVDSDVAKVVFNGLGGTDLAGLTMIRLVPSNGTCQSSGSEFRCLSISIAPGGSIRTCDPQVSDLTDPRIC